MPQNSMTVMTSFMDGPQDPVLFSLKLSERGLHFIKKKASLATLFVALLAFPGIVITASAVDGSLLLCLKQSNKPQFRHCLKLAILQTCRE